MADETIYKGGNKLVTSSYLYAEQQALVTLLKNKFPHLNKDVLDKISVNTSGQICYDNSPIASDVPISKKEYNGLVNEADGLFVSNENDHKHDNKTQLDKISESTKGELLYNKKAIYTPEKSTDTDNILEIKDGKFYVPNKVVASKESGNGISVKEDGIYMSATGVAISEATDNIIKTDENGKLYAKGFELKVDTKTDNILQKNAETGALYVPKTAISKATDNALTDNNGLYVKAHKISKADNNILQEKNDGYYVAKAALSQLEGNALVEKEDGFYVAAGAVQISAEADNQITTKEDGIYVPKPVAGASADANNIIKTGSDDKLFAEHNILIVNGKKPDTKKEVTINLDDVKDGAKRILRSFDDTALSSSYAGSATKMVSSSYLNSWFTNKYTILDKLNKNDKGQLTFDEVAVAADVILDGDKDNIIKKTDSGLLAKHQDISGKMDLDAFTENIGASPEVPNYVLLGSKVKKNTLKHENLADVGTMSHDALELMLQSHIDNDYIHAVASLNCISIKGTEWSAGTLTNFAIDVDGNLGLEKYDEESYTVEKATYISKIYDLTTTLPLGTINYFANYSPYLANVGIYYRVGSTAAVSAETWTEWTDIPADKIFKNISTRYIQIKIEAQTADRTKNIEFGYINIYYGEDEASEIKNAREDIYEVEHATLKARLDTMETRDKVPTEDELEKAIEDTIKEWNDLVYPPEGPSEEGG